MNCRNCGGAMELFATRGYFFCKYCGSFHFPETVTDEGVRVLADCRESTPCPVCQTTMATGVLDEAHGAHYCRTCRGVLVSRGVFADVVQQRRAWTSEPPAAPVPLRREELDRRINCPRCGAALTTHPYYGPGNVVIDSCGGCDVIWLDFGELKQIVEAPGRDRGTRQRPVRLEPASSATPTGDRLVAARGGAVDGIDLLAAISQLILR